MVALSYIYISEAGFQSQALPNLHSNRTVLLDVLFLRLSPSLYLYPYFVFSIDLSLPPLPPSEPQNLSLY